MSVIEMFLVHFLETLPDSVRLDVELCAKPDILTWLQEYAKKMGVAHWKTFPFYIVSVNGRIVDPTYRLRPDDTYILHTLKKGTTVNGITIT